MMTMMWRAPPLSLSLSLSSRLARVAQRAVLCRAPLVARCFSSGFTDSPKNDGDDNTSGTDDNLASSFSFNIDDALTMHHGKRPRFHHKNPKFKSPRKRASKLLHELQTEAVQRSKAANVDVWKTHFCVGDAIEIQYVDYQGGIRSSQVDKMRGVVLGKVNRGLGTSVYIRDVIFGEPVDRKVPLHSPLIKSVRVLEENFVFKKKRRVKRAKLYYLRDRLPTETKVTKW